METLKIQFAKTVETDELDFQNGEYKRRFERKDQPFEITAEEWQTLRRTSYFELVPEAKPTQTGDENASSTEASTDGDEQSSAAPKRTRKSAQNNQQSEDK